MSPCSDQISSRTRRNYPHPKPTQGLDQLLLQ